MNEMMLSADPVFPLSWLLLMLSLLLLITLWGEAKRKAPKKALRLVSAGLLVISLAGLLLRPYSAGHEQLPRAMLLTEDYPVSIADSLKRALPGLSVLRTMGASDYPGSKEIGSYAGLETSNLEISYVLGNGLPVYARASLQSPFRYFPGDQPQGIVSLSLPSNIKPNRRNLLRGTVLSREPAWLRLSGPGGVEDSVLVSDTTSRFELAFVPKLAGRFFYKLEVLDTASGRLDSLNIPVEAAATRQLTIAFVQQFPTFETRYLKNLLAGEGHALALRYQLSRGEYRYEFANRPAFDFRFTSKVLASTDLLFIDAATLSALNRSEKSAVISAVEAGLGLLVWLNDQESWKSVAHWLPFTATWAKSDTSRIATDFGITPLVGSELRLGVDERAYPVWTDGRGAVAAAYGYKGLGRVATVAWNASYRLKLEGKDLQYQDIWLRLTDAVARREEICCELRLMGQAPYYPDEPLPLTVFSGDELPNLSYRGESVPLAEDLLMENVWHGTIWPAAAGWDSLVLMGTATPVYFYVNEEGSWASVSKSRQIRQAKLAAAERAAGPDNKLSIVRKPVPPFIFYLLFLIAATGLWLAPKL